MPEYNNVPMIAATVDTYVGDLGILREVSTDNPICLRTGEPITDTELHVQAWDEDYPNILFGPYSEDAWPYVKICSACHTPHMVDVKEDIDYYGSGKWLCTECAENIIKCPQCDKIATHLCYVEGVEMCPDCLDDKYFIDEYSGDFVQRSFNAVNVCTDLQIKQYSDMWKDYKAISYESFQILKSEYTPNPVKECKCCSDILVIMEGDYCDNCLDEYVYTCNICGNLHHIADRDHCNICPTCISKMAKCFITGACKLRKDMFLVKTPNGPQYCVKEEESSANNYTMCPTCGCMIEKDRLIKRNKYTYCTQCEHKLNFCTECNKPHMGEHQCRSHTNISGYSYKPLPVMHRSFAENKELNAVPLYMGFENEQAYTDSGKMDTALSFISSKFSTTELYFKSDSSIRGQGFEVVSHPFTLDAFRKLPLSYLFKTKLKAKDNGCGMHVHINKTFFNTDLHLYKFTNFINEDSGFVEKIAGRASCSYSSKMKNVSKSVKYKETQRHSFVNLTNKHTAEVRIFKGALNMKELKYRLEFVDAVGYWSQSASLKDGVKSFISFITKNSKRYSNLLEFIKE